MLSVIDVLKTLKSKLSVKKAAMSQNLCCQESDFQKILLFQFFFQNLLKLHGMFSRKSFPLREKKNSNHVGSHHAEGFQDSFMYKEDRYAKTIYTRDESPCTFLYFIYLKVSDL